MKPKRNPFHILASTTLVFAFSAVSNLHADTVSWNGGTSSWDDTANWSSNTLPTNSDTALFGGTTGTVTATAAQSVSGLEFTSSGYTLGGSTLTIGTGGIDASTLTSGTTTINSPIFVGNGIQRWNVGAGATLATGTLGVGGNATHTYDPFGGIVIIKGTVTTTAANGWDWRGGGGSQGLLGPGFVIDNGNGTYDWARKGTDGLISAPTYVAAGTGDKNNVLITSNTSLNLNASWASIKVDGATFSVNGTQLYVDTGIILQNGATISGSAPIKANSDGLYVYTPDSCTIATSIQNNGSNAKLLYKAGSGTLTLSGNNNSYTAGTKVLEGSLLVTNASGSATGSGAVSVAAAGTLGGTGIVSTGSGVAVNGTIAAGNSPGATGTLTLSAATTFNDGSIFSWDISSDGANFDKLKTNSLLDGGVAGGSIFRIVLGDSAFADTFWDTTQSWSNIFTTDGNNPIANWANLFSTLQVVDSVGSAVAPTKGAFSLSGNTLTWSAVPEPGSALAGLLIGAGILRRRRK